MIRDDAPLVALTGATGFIGQHLMRELPRRGFRVRILLRRPQFLPPGCASAVIGDLANPRNMNAAFSGVTAVVHSAGIAHRVSGVPEDDYRAINTDATVALATAAQRAGVRRFVFLSSIRAQCGPTCGGAVAEDQEPKPADAYGRSKLEAEQRLSALDLDCVALRPVLVYGPGVKGNMAELLKLAHSPYPLPFGMLKAKRSLLSVQNLVDAIVQVLAVREPVGGPLIVADQERLTVGEMVTVMRRAVGRAPGLIPVPGPILRAALIASGRPNLWDRIAGSLVADTSRLRALGWSPRVSTQAGLAALSTSFSPANPG